MSTGPEWLSVSAGRPRPPRWLLGLAAAVVVVALVALGLRVHRYEQQVIPTPSPTPLVSAATTPPPSQQPDPSGLKANAVYHLPHPLLGITGSWELFGYGTDGVVRFEPAAARVTVSPVGEVHSSGPLSFVVGRDRALVRPLDSVPGYQVADGRPATGLRGSLTSGGWIFPGPDPDHVWQITAGDSTRGDLVSLAGRLEPKHFTMPEGGSGFTATGDRAGNVAVGGVGGTYLATADGLHKITAGILLAIGPTRWLTEECDTVASCSAVVTDRHTGRQVRLAALSLGPGSTPGVISPDGETAVIPIPTITGQQYNLVDLHTGGLRQIAVPIAGPQPDAAVWSPDSRWLFLLGADRRTYAVNPATGGAQLLTLPLNGLLDALAIRDLSDQDPAPTR